MSKLGEIKRPTVGETKHNYTFPNGMIVSGTIEQLQEVATKLSLTLDYVALGHRPPGYYISTSRGLIKMSAMHEYHLRRAIIKEAKEYMAGVFDGNDETSIFLTKFVGLADSPVIIDLYTELAKRITSNVKSAKPVKA